MSNRRKLRRSQPSPVPGSWHMQVVPPAAPVADRSYRVGVVPVADGPIEVLRKAVRAREIAEARQVAAVVAARAAGYSWADIAGPLGISPQGARQRFSAVVDGAA